MRMASAVEFDPVPAITFVRPRARSQTNATTRSFSSCVSVGDSPVVPQGASASVPCSQCQSTSLPRSSQSTSPFLNGVTIATVTQTNNSPRVAAMTNLDNEGEDALELSGYGRENARSSCVKRGVSQCDEPFQKLRYVARPMQQRRAHGLACFEAVGRAFGSGSNSPNDLL